MAPPKKIKRERIKLNKRPVSGAQEDTLFKSNEKKRAGRKPGSRNKITVLIKECTIRAAQAVGEDGKGKGGLEGYLKKCATEERKAFMGLLGRILPMQITGNVNYLNINAEDLRALPDSKVKLLEEVLTLIGSGGDTASVEQLIAGSQKKTMANPNKYAASISNKSVH